MDAAISEGIVGKKVVSPICPQNSYIRGSGNNLTVSPEMAACPTCGRDDFKNEHGMKVHHEYAHDQSLNETVCEWCECTYITHYDGQRFCSNECRAEWMSSEKNGEEHNAWKDEAHEEITCEECGDVTTVWSSSHGGRFCSDDCRISWFRRWLSEEQNGESHPNWKPGTCERRGDNWEEQRLKAILRDQARCQNCRKPAHALPRGYVDLCVHHIVRYGDFDSYEEANRVDNLVTLCRSCHCKVENTGDKIWMK